jgi:hypothetical protein
MEQALPTTVHSAHVGEEREVFYGCLTRKNALFAGHEVGAENWALLSSLVATCRLNDVNPVAYIAETLDAIINGHPKSAVEDLMPWYFRKTSIPNP